MAIKQTDKDELKKEGHRIGYARVSTREQNLDLQLDALNKAKCYQIYQEKISSRKANRPELEHALKALREGDTLVIWKLDRLGRSLTELIRIVDDLKERKVYLESISDKVDTETAMGKMFFQFMGMMAEYERNVIQERTAILILGQEGVFGRIRVFDGYYLWA